MILMVLLIAVLVFIVSLLLMPIVFFVDTSTHQYYLQLRGLAKANLEADDDQLIRIKLKLLFFSFYFYPLKKRLKAKKTDKTKPINKMKSIRKFNIKTGLRLLKSFKIKTIFVDIDTGDCITNAQLYPIFSLLNYYKNGFNINFKGNNRIILSIQNRPIYIIKSIINL